jgi:hypothetical protein
MSSRPRGRMTAIIGVSVAAVGALGAFGVNSWARADSIDAGYHRLVLNLKHPAQSIYILGKDAGASDFGQGFCVSGPLAAGLLSTPYRAQNLSTVKIIPSQSPHCDSGPGAETTAQVPGDDGILDFTINVDN